MLTKQTIISGKRCGKRAHTKAEIKKIMDKLIDNLIDDDTSKEEAKSRVTIGILKPGKEIEITITKRSKKIDIKADGQMIDLEVADEASNVKTRKVRSKK